jgi:hypothetical protein
MHARFLVPLKISFETPLIKCYRMDAIAENLLVQKFLFFEDEAGNVVGTFVLSPHTTPL